MTTFKRTRDERTMEFRIKAGATVASYRGTRFVPNRMTVRLFDGEIFSLSFDRMQDEWTVAPDPTDEDCELSISYGGGELAADYLPKLPKIAQDALAEVKRLTS